MITSQPITPDRKQTTDNEGRWYFFPLALLFILGIAAIVMCIMFFVISTVMDWVEGKTLLEAFMDKVYFIGELLKRLY